MKLRSFSKPNSRIRSFIFVRMNNCLLTGSGFVWKAAIILCTAYQKKGKIAWIANKNDEAHYVLQGGNVYGN